MFKNTRKSNKRKVDIRIPKIFLISSGISFMLSVYLLLSENGIFTYIKQKRQISQLENEIKLVKEQITDIETRKYLIKTRNREYLERVFRKFGWVKEGEKIIKIESNPSNSSNIEPSD